MKALHVTMGSNTKTSRTANQKALRHCERLLFLIGLLALGAYGAAFLHSHFNQAYDQWAFDQSLKGRPVPLKAFLAHQVRELISKRVTEKSEAPAWMEENADQKEWSPKRIQAYQRSLSSNLHAPLGRLQIPSLGLSVIVLEGTDEWTLNRAVGHIEGTALPGEDGNVAIAGHRDGFFRVLRKISKGDRILLTTSNGTYQYCVSDIQIVSPEDIQVLNATSRPTLTLVTCYPFYYVGDAPQRFIVQAQLVTAQ